MSAYNQPFCIRGGVANWHPRYLPYGYLPAIQPDPIEPYDPHAEPTAREIELSPILQQFMDVFPIKDEVKEEKTKKLNRGNFPPVVFQDYESKKPFIKKLHHGSIVR